MGSTKKPLFTPEERRDHLIESLSKFLQKEAIWGCPAYTQRKDFCGNPINQKRVEKIKDTSLRQLLTLLENQKSAALVDRNSPEHEMSSADINHAISTIACHRHKEELLSVMEMFEHTRLSAKVSEDSTNLAANSSIIDDDVSVKKEPGTPVRSGMFLPSPGRKDVSKNSFASASLSADSKGNAKFWVDSVTPTRPAPTVIQPSPLSFKSENSDFKSLYNSSIYSGTPGSTFSHDSADPFTPMTPPSMGSGSMAFNQPSCLSDIDGKNSPTLRRSARIRAQRDRIAHGSRHDEKTNAQSVGERYEDEVGSSIPQPLFTGKRVEGGNREAGKDQRFDAVSRPPLGPGPAPGYITEETGDKPTPSEATDATSSDEGLPIKQNTPTTLRKRGASPNIAGAGSQSCHHTGNEPSNSAHGTKPSASPRMVQLEPYKHKIDPAKIVEVMNKDIGKDDELEGRIYVMHHDKYIPAEPDDNRRLYKIGFTEKASVEERYEKDACKEILNYTSQVFFSPQRFMHAYRAERLVQEYLGDKRMEMVNCPCGKRHKEWFLGTEKQMLDAVLTCSRLVGMDQMYVNGKLSLEAQKQILCVWDPERLVGEFEASFDMGTSSQPAKLAQTTNFDERRENQQDYSNEVNPESVEAHTNRATSPHQRVASSQSPDRQSLDIQISISQKGRGTTETVQEKDKPTRRPKSMSTKFSVVLNMMEGEIGVKAMWKSMKRSTLDPAEVRAPATAEASREPKLGLLRRTTGELFKSKR
ncbi:hypothetical protein HJFPF1_03988 [Paramyrothecium foliicola]|nr:hypothetical protein HJFPF1_03988 [Paramyrothecium foliicola]